MAKFSLRINNDSLEKGWSAKLIADFDPVAGCGEETFWVKVVDIHNEGGKTKYVGTVQDYLTYPKSHGMTQGFLVEFGPEHVSEIRRPGQKPT